MKPTERDAERLDPEIERQLEAIERALAGEAVDPDLADLATLTADLRAERATPPESWAREMDARAAAGFGRSRSASVLRSLRGLLGERPRRLLLPAGAVATLLVVVGVGISTIDGGSTSDQLATTAAAPVPEVAAGDETAAQGPGGPAVRDRASEQLTPKFDNPEDAAVAGSVGTGTEGTAPGETKRRQDRNAFLALKTSAGEVREVSDQAIQITESAGGVVLSSELSEQGQRATANLELSIPTRELDGTLDRLTDLATVKSLNEAALDITKPFVSARDRLRDARAERARLLEALGNASTDAEAQALRAQLRDVRRKISRAEAAFNNIARRARTSRVSVAIAGTPDNDGGWSLGDAADDALSVLKAVAGVLLISAAILAPLALLAAAVTAIALAVRRRRRERALDQDD